MEKKPWCGAPIYVLGLQWKINMVSVFSFMNSNASHFKAYHLLSYCLSQRHKVRREFSGRTEFSKEIHREWIWEGSVGANRHWWCEYKPAQLMCVDLTHCFILLTSTAWKLHQMNLEKHHSFFVPTASSNHKDVLKQANDKKCGYVLYYDNIPFILLW